MKKLLSLFVVAIMAMSMCVITASADDGFYPVDAGTFQVLGDWDFEEATIADNLTIPSDGNGTVTYANGGVTFTEEAGGMLPGIQFLPSKVPSAPEISDYVYYEFTVDMREVSEYGKFRLNLMNSVRDDKPAGYINVGPEYIAFYCVNGGGSGKEVDTVNFTAAANESKTKIGMLVNLSEKYYAGYINGEMVCEKTFSDQTMRAGKMTGGAYLASMVEITEDYAITFYDYKFYKGVSKSELPYAKVQSWDFATDATVAGGTDGAYTTTTTDGINVAMTADGAFPTITLAAKNPGGTFTTDMYYYEFVLNSGSLKTDSAYTITFTGKVGSTAKTFYTIDVYKDKLFLKRGNGGWSTTKDIPANVQGTDMKLGLLIDQNDGSKGQTYVYLNRALLTQAGNNDRTSYHPYAQAITISDNATVTKTAGEAIVLKSLDTYYCAESATPVVTPAIPTEGAFSATASYTANAGTVTANVTLTKAGNAGWYNKDTVIVASYTSEGALIDFQKVDGKVKGGATETISLTVNAQAGGKVRAFLWDDMNTLVPTATFDVHDVG